MIIVFMALIMTKRTSVLAALIIVPIIFALLGGFGSDIGPMMINGVKGMAPVAAMLTFAILFFGIMIDVGLFDPLVKFVVHPAVKMLALSFLLLIATVRIYFKVIASRIP